VRQFVAHALERRLADQLRDECLLRLVGEHVVRVQLRRLRQVLGHDVDERVEVLAGHGADGHDVGEVSELADRDQLLGQPGPVHQVNLGYHGDHPRLETGDFAADETVAAPDLLVRGDAQSDDVDLAPGLPDEVVEALAQQRARTVQAGRVDEDELCVGPVQHAPDHVAGRLRLA
jgi:hypothetical protein